MSDIEVIPEGETTGWASRWTQEEVTTFVMGTCKTNMNFPHSKPWTDLKEMELNIMGKYSEQTNKAREQQDSAGGGTINSLVSVLLGGGGGKRRRSMGKVQLQPGDGGVGF